MSGAVALSRGRSSIARDLVARASAAVIGAAKQQGVSRLGWTTSIGVGDIIASATVTEKIGGV